MFNAIVQTDVRQIKGILAVIFVQQVGHLIRDVIGEGCRKVVNFPALFGRLFERDVAAIPRKYTLNRISREPSVEREYDAHHD